ncbi:ATP-dependent DNA helicase RecQ [Kribbella sandramycini]|uniref:DNA 3'-5' helicase n=1 Tax=Kribbella sandramycini TaxID=60450 RepID=A0A7Y4L0D0_9ACTN|nr:DEAD/DEAH box helicase [Kribbella sandramycini]MBB6569163.1 ATP-dependent DNA helicase RecQ [Kribbella sandramycini]NOL40996.1 ATP-dependent DNA helicase RecQ [Kribbella sandramycini]
MADSTLTLTEARAGIAGGVIQAIAGESARLRADQETAVAALCEAAARVLVVQATGWGKSAVYWAATAIRRAEGAGPTLVVSPLLSLMRDQVGAAGRAGLRAATLNSNNVDEWSSIEHDLRSGAIDVLLVSPERLANPGFGRRVLDGLAGQVGLLVIDEAHAVSDWGHDFRPDYRRVSDVLQTLNPKTPVLATTATANARVTDDVARQLGESTLVLRGPLARSSLQLAVVNALSPLDRFAWVVDHLPQLPGSGIVYTLTVADAQRLAATIQEIHGRDVPVAAYTGGLEAGERESLEDALRENRLKALIATSALGMGYDKPDLGFVVHVGSPPSPVSYYQQVGRAGRGIDHAVVALLPSDADSGIWDYFATATIPVPENVNRLLRALDGYGPDQPATAPALEAETGLRRTRVELMLKQLSVDGAVERVERGWVRTGKDWTFDAAHYDGIVAVRRREADIMRAYTRGESCLMQLLQESLDDPSAEPCGRCSVCLGALPAPLTAAPSPDTRAAITRLLRGEVHTLEPRKMWPGGAFGAKGKIPAGLMAEPGRSLIYADAPEWREVLADAFAGGSPASESVEALQSAAVAALSRWRTSWSSRPEIIIPLPAAGHADVLTAVAAHVALVGRLDHATIPVDRSAFTDDLSSAEEARIWRDGLTIQPETAQAITARTVLLLVDASSSQWPVTVAAAKLREAGAAAVLPMLLHKRP